MLTAGFRSSKSIRYNGQDTIEMVYGIKIKRYNIAI